MTGSGKVVDMCPETLPPFEVSIMSSELAVREALTKFLDAIRPLKLAKAETGMIELVLAEVLNNIVEHAYRDAQASGPIAIHCAQQRDGLMIRIRDEGARMPDGQLPFGTLKPIDVDLEEMPEGGFGWFLIQHLAKDVSYARVDGENHLRMRLAVGMHSQ
jgi:serine/threonine-protein kinase RsbW